MRVFSFQGSFDNFNLLAIQFAIHRNWIAAKESERIMIVDGESGKHGRCISCLVAFDPSVVGLVIRVST